MSDETIYVTRGGTRLVGGTVRETNDKDISADPIVVGISGSDQVPPDRADGIAPTTDVQGATTAERLVTLLIDNTFEPAKDRHLWAWVDDDPEVEPIHLDGPFTIA